MEVAKVTKLSHDIEISKLKRKLLVYRLLAFLLALSLLATVTWCNFVIRVEEEPQEAVICVSGDNAVMPTANVSACHYETKRYTEDKFA